MSVKRSFLAGIAGLCVMACLSAAPAGAEARAAEAGTVLFDSNSGSVHWAAGHVTFSTARDAAHGNAKVITITKADRSVEWGTFHTAWIPVEAARGRRVEISLSLKIDSLVPYNERQADFFRPKIMFYPDTKTMQWKGNCGEVFLERFKQPIGWTDLKYEVDVPLQAKVALLSFPFGDVDGVVHLYNVRISAESILSSLTHNPHFTRGVLVPRRQAGSEPATLRLKDAQGREIVNRVSFDERGLYFDLKVPDQKFFQPYHGAEIWHGDSVQMAFDCTGSRSASPDAKSDYEMGFTQVDGKPFIYPDMVPPDYPFRLLDILYEFAAGPAGLHYKITLPWTALRPFSYDQQNSLGYAFLVNANDGQGRTYCEWAGGIGPKKCPAKYGVLLLDKKKRGGAATVLPDATECLDNGSVTGTILMPSRAAGTVRLSLSLNGAPLAERTCALQPGENSIAYKLVAAQLSAGENTLTVRVDAPPGNVALLDQNLRIVQLSSKETADKARALQQQADAGLKELKTSLAPYEHAELKPREQIASSAVVSLFLPYITEDLKASHFTLALQEAEDTLQVVQAAQQQMKDGDFILSREKSVLGVKACNGRLVNAQSETVYLMGFCNSDMSLPDYAVQKRLGLNLETQSWPTRLKKIADPPGYSLTTPIVERYHKIALKRAHNVALNLSPQIPSELRRDPLFAQLYPDSKTPGNHFLDFDPDHPAVRQFLELASASYGKTYAEMPEADRRVIVSCDIANEPAFTSITPYTLRDLRAFLTRKYQTIRALNAAWKTDFASFDAIADIRPLLPDDRHKVTYYDWCRFNDRRCYEFFHRMNEAAWKNSGPVPLPTHVKFMNDETWCPYVTFDRGYDRELDQRLSDVNGGDGGPRKLPLGSPYAFNWMRVALPVEYLHSLAPQKPGFDDEWHLAQPFLKDPQAMRAAIWLTAWHGQCCTSLFATFRDAKRHRLYRQYDYGSDAWYAFVGNMGIDVRPHLMETFTQEGIRIQNNIERVRSFVENDHPVAIYCSLPSAIYDGKRHIETVEAMFDAFYFQDVGVGFISDRMLADGRIPKGTKLLIIPQARYADPAAVAALDKADAAGVRVLWVGEENFSRDLQNQPLAATPKLTHARQWPQGEPKDYRARAAAAVRQAGIQPAFALCNKAGRHPDYVSARFALCGDKTVGYAVNLGTEPQEFRLLGPDGKVVAIRNCLAPEGKKAAELTKVSLRSCEFLNFDVLPQFP